jgi:hypothetical protein
MVRRALERTDGNITAAARLLNMSRNIVTAFANLAKQSRTSWLSSSGHAHTASVHHSLR